MGEALCQVVREQPFRGTTNDVMQTTNRCNTDHQFLTCVPPPPADDSVTTNDGDVVRSSTCTDPGVGSAIQPSARRRIRTKTREGSTKVASQQPPRSKKPPWFPNAAKLSSGERGSILSFAAAFQKAASMDFYILKYQGKPMESLTPLFKGKVNSVRLQFFKWFWGCTSAFWLSSACAVPAT